MDKIIIALFIMPIVFIITIVSLAYLFPAIMGLIFELIMFILKAGFIAFFAVLIVVVIKSIK